MDVLQGEKNCFFGFLLPSILTAVHEYREMKNLNFEVLNDIVDCVIESIKKRFHVLFTKNSTSKMAVISALLIPGFKLRWVNIYKSLFEGDGYNNIIEMLIETEGKPQSINSPTNENDATYSTFNFGDEEVNHYSVTGLEAEIATYMTDNRKEISMISNFSELKTIFMKYNVCLPSSAPVERLFSISGIVNSSRRGKLKDDVFEALVCLKANKWDSG